MEQPEWSTQHPPSSIQDANPSPSRASHSSLPKILTPIQRVVLLRDELLDDQRSLHPRYEESSQATSVQGPHPLVDDDYDDDDGSSLGPHAFSANVNRPQTSAGHENQRTYADDERKVYQPDRRPGTTEFTGRQR